MKISFPALYGFILLFAGCDSRSPDPLAAERQKLEAERSAFNAEKGRLAEEQQASQKAAAEAENRRLSEMRTQLEAANKILADEARRLERSRAAREVAERAAQEAAQKKAKEPAPLEIEMADAPAEPRKKVEARSERDRTANHRAEAEASERETAKKKAEAEARLSRTEWLFYDVLAGHGDWLESEAYGYVWRPTRAKFQAEWRPYADGRWQWTEYGWTWQSQEPYGWAVFHYGRWFRSPKHGWLWVPGTEWAPAWVAWRTKGSEYVGWAPLPPESREARTLDTSVDHRFNLGPWSYVFLPVQDFDLPTYVHKFVPRDRQMEVLRGSRNVTVLVAHQTPQGSVVTSGGPDTGRVGSAIREIREEPEAQPVPRLNLVFANAVNQQATGDVVEGGAMMLFAPRLEKAPSGTKPKNVQEKLAGRDVDRGWADGPFEAEWRAVLQRELVAAEAAKRPPPVRPVAKAAEPEPAPEPARPPPPVSRPNPLNPARLQPSGPLLGK